MRRPSRQTHWPESSMMYSPVHCIVSSVALCRCAPNRLSNRKPRLIADDDAVGACASGSDIVLFKEGNSELRKTHRCLKRAAGYGRREFTGDEGLLRSGLHRGGDHITVIESESGAGLRLVVGGIDIHHEIKVLAARGEDGHLG